MHRTITSRESRIRPPGGAGIHVLTRFPDAERGLVLAPAASLLAADLTRRLARSGSCRPVTLRPGAGLTSDGDKSGAVMYSTTFTQRNGSTVGFALAADAADQQSVELAAAAVKEWAAALRSRRLLIADLDTLCSNAGGPNAENHSSGDGCPKSSTTHRDLRAFAARGDTVIVIGDPDDAAAKALAAAEPSVTVTVCDPAQVPTLAVPNGREVSFVVSPSCPAEQAFSALSALRARFPALSGHNFDALCGTTTDRAEAVTSVAAAADLMLIGASDPLDGGIRPISRALRSVGLVRVLAEPEQLDVADLAEATTIGLACTPDASPELTARLVRSLSGLGPLTTRQRSVSTVELPTWDIEPRNRAEEPDVEALAA
jgi:LytB protein